MSLLPILSARVVMRKLARAGFRLLYVRGSHYYFGNPLTNRLTGVPVHGSKPIGKPLLSKIIKQAGLSVKEFLDL
jgi:predicted RNA binding protein YcfA (HicA-like mRNA interferase family)